MDCRDAQPLLDPYREGLLSPAEMDQVAEHLGRCWDCRNRAHELEQWTQALAVLPPAEPRPELLAATLQRLPGPGRAARRPMPAGEVLALATGAGAALLAFFWLIGEALRAFESAGGAEFAGLIGAHPEIVLQDPLGAALALLEALPWVNLLMGLLSALVAGSLSARLLNAQRGYWGWPQAIRGVA